MKIYFNQLKNENNFNAYNLKSEDPENDFEEKDTVFDYDRYSASAIREIVIKDIKNYNIYEDIEIIDEENRHKNYDFY